MEGSTMDKNYIVYGIDVEGKSHELTRSPVARDARRTRDAEREKWPGIEVTNFDGPLSDDELNYYSDAGHRYA